jgi:hypothetical protein
MPWHETDYSSAYDPPAADEARADRKQALRSYLDALVAALLSEEAAAQSRLWRNAATRPASTWQESRAWLNRPDLAPYYNPCDDAYPAALYERLRAVMERQGYLVEEHGSEYMLFERAARGIADVKTRKTQIVAEMRAPIKLETLVHEYTHQLLHDETCPWWIREVQAAGVSHVVCSALGINNPERSEYFEVNWTCGPRDAVELIPGEADTILDTAAMILEQLEAFGRFDEGV